MTDPSTDESTPGGSEPGVDSEAPSDHPKTTVGRPVDAIEPSTQKAQQPPAAGTPAKVYRPPADHHQETAAVDEAETASEDSVSNWWYAVAAVPIYVLVGIVGGVFAFVLFLFGIAVDVSGGMGLATGLVVALLTVGVIGYALTGLALSILFPVGIYLDAKAVSAAEHSWDPDAVLYLLVAVASVLLSAFALSAVVALYYLYRRNEAVGVP